MFGTKGNEKGTYTLMILKLNHVEKSFELEAEFETEIDHYIYQYNVYGSYELDQIYILRNGNGQLATMTKIWVYSFSG